ARTPAARPHPRPRPPAPRAAARRGPLAPAPWARSPPPPQDAERVEPLLACGPRDRLRMVAGGDGDHPACTLGVGELGEPVQRAAHLERAGALEQLRLQERLRADPLRECRRADQRRAVNAPRDRPRRALDVVERDHVREATRMGCARRIVNVVSRPGSLSTETVPPIASVSSFTIASPSPVPTGRSRP